MTGGSKQASDGKQTEPSRPGNGGFQRSREIQPMKKSFQAVSKVPPASLPLVGLGYGSSESVVISQSRRSVSQRNAQAQLQVAMSICRTVYAIPSLTSTNSSVDYWRLRGGRKTIASSSCSKGGRNGDNKKQAEQGKPNSSRGRKSAKRLREQGGVRLLY